MAVALLEISAVITRQCVMQVFRLCGAVFLSSGIAVAQNLSRNAQVCAGVQRLGCINAKGCKITFIDLSESYRVVGTRELQTSNCCHCLMKRLGLRNAAADNADRIRIEARFSLHNCSQGINSNTRSAALSKIGKLISLSEVQWCSNTQNEDKLL